MTDEEVTMKSVGLQRYFTLLHVLGAKDARVIDPATVVTAPWPVFKCQYGCGTYGKSWCCPPKTPTYQEMRNILDCYDSAILFHFNRMGNLTQVAQKVAKQMFLDGYYKVIALGSGPCRLCKTCTLNRDSKSDLDCDGNPVACPSDLGCDGAISAAACRFPEEAIPAMEACGIDVYATARNNGFEIATLSDVDEAKNFYGLLLVE